jgi:hypothetical protein
MIKGKPIQVYIAKEHHEFFKKMGGGNMSKGLRAAYFELTTSPYFKNGRFVANVPENIVPAPTRADRTGETYASAHVSDSMEVWHNREGTPFPDLVAMEVLPKGFNQPTTNFIPTNTPIIDDRPRRKTPEQREAERLAAITHAPATLPILPTPPSLPSHQPPLPAKKPQRLLALNIDQTKRVYEQLGIPPQTKVNIMVTTGGNLWVQEYTNPVTGQFVRDQEVDPNTFDPPL